MSDRLIAERPTCAACKNEIDPDTCWCGSERNWHDGSHHYVPMGCNLLLRPVGGARSNGGTRMNATETVQRARGFMWCERHSRWLPPGWRDIEFFPHDNACGEPADPLADTPEGDHEFMAILRWADARELGRTCLQRMLEYDYALLGGPDFKAAFLEALAAAIKGEQG